MKEEILRMMEEEILRMNKQEEKDYIEIQLLNRTKSEPEPEAIMLSDQHREPVDTGMTWKQELDLGPIDYSKPLDFN